MRILTSRRQNFISGIDPALSLSAQVSGREDSLIMSELTFNIADYRPLSRVRTHDTRPAWEERRGFVVLTSNVEPRRDEPAWLAPQPQVVEIRSLREAHRPRHAKILRFRNPASHHVYIMPAHHTDDDPGPMVA